mgnify:FL=1
MAIIKYKNVGIRAISACVPKNTFSNYDLGYMMPSETITKLVDSIGIKEKRYVDDDVCSSDLCFKAASQLIEENDIDPKTVDMILFVSLTPDYIMPPTSSILQHRLGLSSETACLDISLACSGYVYGLSAAFAYASMSGMNRVLLLVGETMSKLANRKDRVNFPLYGDAGTATLIEKGDFPESIFALSSGGEGEKEVIVPHGGFRNNTTADSLVEKEREDGNYRRDVDITMDGMATFNHAVSAVPKQIKQLLTVSGDEHSDIDYLVSHQANKFMIDFIVKRLKFDKEKVPFCIQRFGNTSAASIPLTIVSELEGKLIGKKKLLLTAIGAGWSLGAAIISTDNIKISTLTEY